MSDSNISNHKEKQKASQAIEDNRDRSSDLSNAAQKLPQTPQSVPVEKEKPAKDQLKEDIAHHNEIRKSNTSSNVSSRDKFGKVGFGSEPLHSPESNIAPTTSRQNAVTIVEVYELLLASCARILSRFRAKHRKKRTIYFN
ncbi:hypothetical protein BCON_0400g00080 [Botryotinia convoluta]|uniref:Uncharacterized protein n=1 Tax=Botryotinia convoluta TaxID=54673 RepID=A0A4Z1H859_9HELO|nr:hypothetical protein BCON_0400g00080 [Botryotinia convoluta]